MGLLVPRPLEVPCIGDWLPICFPSAWVCAATFNLWGTHTGLGSSLEAQSPWLHTSSSYTSDTQLSSSLWDHTRNPPIFYKWVKWYLGMDLAENQKEYGRQYMLEWGLLLQLGWPGIGWLTVTGLYPGSSTYKMCFLGWVSYFCSLSSQYLESVDNNTL